MRLTHKSIALLFKKLTLLEDCTVVDIIEKYKGQFYKLAGVRTNIAIITLIPSDNDSSARSQH